MAVATTKRRRHRLNEDHPDGTLTEIHKDRLATAIQLRGWSVRGLAAAVGMTQQTLDYIVRGRNRKCRQRHRVALARKLRVPETWLAGDGHLPYTWDRLEYDDHGRVTIPLLRPLGQLAASEFITRCLNAWRRDLVEGSAPVPRAYPNLCSVFRKEVIAEYVGFALYELLDPLRWQRTASSKTASVTVADRDKGTLALVEAADAILAPWLDGRAELDYRRAYTLIEDVLSSARWAKPEKPKRRAKARKKKR